MANDALATVGLRVAFYRDTFRAVVGIFLLSIVANIVLGLLLFYQYTHPPAPKYFATSVNGRITPLFSLSKPNQSDAAVLQWANQVAIATFTYNFVDYRQQLRASSEFFTPQGWANFLSALDDSNTLDAVKAKKLIVSAVATAAPIVLRKGPLLGRGRYAWRVQMPLLVTYQSASEFSQERYIVTMLITRISSLNSPRGIGVDQIVFQPAGGGVVQ